MNTDLKQVIDKLSPLDVFAVLRFFTAWCLVIVIFHKQLYKHVDILFLTAVVFVVGSYASHIYPKKFILRLTNQNIYLEGLQKFFFVDVIHIGMFVIAIKYYSKYYLTNKTHWVPLTNAVMIMWAYLLIIQPETVYNIRSSDFALVMSVAILLYLSVLYTLRRIVLP
jgi:hypothetical protein